MFPQETISFLQELAGNNNREWFNANKERYEEQVRTPALDFIAIRHLPTSSIHESDFPKLIGKQLKTTAPLMKFLCDANDLMF